MGKTKSSPQCSSSEFLLASSWLSLLVDRCRESANSTLVPSFAMAAREHAWDWVAMWALSNLSCLRMRAHLSACVCVCARICAVVLEHICSLFNFMLLLPTRVHLRQD